MPDAIEKIVGDVSASIETMKKDNAALMEQLRGGVAQSTDKASAAVKAADELAQKIAGFSNKIVDLEQKLAQNVISGKAAPASLGQMVIKSDAYKQFCAGNSSKMIVQANTITGQSGSPAENSDILVPAQRLGGIVGGALRSLRVRDALPSGQTNSNSIEYTRELLFTNNAAEVAEGASKPESVLTFELVNTPVRTIAHFLKVSKQVLDDAPALASYIDTRLRYGVELKYENQLVAGNGTSGTISGLTDSGNYTAFTPATGDTALDSINKAIYQAYAADYAPTAIMMNPADWGAIERLKDNNLNYLVGNPQGVVGAVLWGLPVVVTNAMTAGKLLVGSFDIASQVWNRMGTVVEMFEQDGDNVTKNLLTIRAENRGCLASYRPASVFYGNLTL